MDRVLYNGVACLTSCGSVKVNMTRDDFIKQNESVDVKFFDFADKNKDQVLDEGDYNRFVCLDELYPGLKRKNMQKEFYNCLTEEEMEKQGYFKKFDLADEDNNFEISENEFEKYINKKVEFSLLADSYKKENSKIHTHDKSASTFLGILGLVTSIAGHFATKSTPLSKKNIDWSRCTDFAKRNYKSFCNVDNVMRKYVGNIAKYFGIALFALSVIDICMANKADKQRQKLKNEYYNKTEDYLSKYPQYEPAMEFKHELY
ncbi:MAG: hypothetical protein MJ237_08515 [bacterium]|nr:hypothetical protein [bacterium]